MADRSGNGTATNDTQPQLNSLAQYVKDFSFENPTAPRSLAPQENAPNISIQVNVNARQLAEADYEVELVLEGQAGEGQNVLFKFELHYAGVFRVRNVPQQNIAGVIMIECPRMLFPFARHIIADVVRNGGFPPLYIDPIDFVALFQQRAAAQGQAQASPPTASA
jgi:preprotein translocase subunit SecB